jgi:hypothetical protein
MDIQNASKRGKLLCNQGIVVQVHSPGMDWYFRLYPRYRNGKMDYLIWIG